MREPAITAGVVLAVLQTAMGLAIAFGVKLSPDQVAAVMATAGAVFALISAVFVRSQVTPLSHPPEAE